MFIIYTRRFLAEEMQVSYRGDGDAPPPAEKAPPSEGLPEADQLDHEAGSDLSDTLDVNREDGVAIGSRRMGAMIKQRAFNTRQFSLIEGRHFAPDIL